MPCEHLKLKVCAEDLTQRRSSVAKGALASEDTQNEHQPRRARRHERPNITPNRACESGVTRPPSAVIERVKSPRLLGLQRHKILTHQVSGARCLGAPAIAVGS